MNSHFFRQTLLALGVLGLTACSGADLDEASGVEDVSRVEQAATCACASGQYHNGTPIPVSATYCGFRVCGVGNVNFECTSTGWVSVPGSTCGAGQCRCSGGSDDQGRAIDPNITECGFRVCGGDKKFYTCGTGGWTSTGVACSSTGGTTGSPLCLGSQAGAYCGNDSMSNAVASTLYQCPGANQAPTSSQACPNGCVVAPAGTADYCAGVQGGQGYRLPWPRANALILTQDCNDSCCNDHVGVDKYAWDFAMAGNVTFPVVAARGGIVTHLKMNSVSGCNSNACVNQANFMVIDHGDGTHSTYLHLKGGSLAAGVTCGGSVVRGQQLATAGNTGWSSANHLHFEVSGVHPGAPTCECGSTGQGCSASTVPWANFWPSTAYPTVAIQFEEWPAASTCANRAGLQMPWSMN
ncbi:M23 family metallopeptidase [Corallococcus carmarthensis]|uniref:M23 family metallopeptidase n=1 Tax=Corallococcus carmarthensis TaxID=2316728 RepID=A0A3A8KHA4_9BACT|nr:M23 family metallopeptidase [Corallococcus carmarthensis]RKH07513.1 M23 family metallopeptidase [Corallococcus carmarthensis]